MAKVFVSPGVFTRELDLSFVPAAIQDIGAALVGPTLQGPAFTPITISTFDDFRAIYGGTDKDLFLPYSAKAYLANGSSLTVLRILGTENSTNQGQGYYIRFGGSALTGSAMAILRNRAGSAIEDVKLSGTPTNFTLSATDGSFASNLSFNQSSENYIGTRLGTDATAANASDALSGLYLDKIFDYNFDNINGRGLTLGGVTNPAASGDIGQGSIVASSFKTDTTSGITAVFGMASLSATNDAAGQVNSTFANGSTPFVVSQNQSGTLTNLFKIHMLESGESSSNKSKINIVMQDAQISSSAFPKFTVNVRKFGDTDANAQVEESFSNCSLDPNSSNFIAKVIGDRYPIWTGLGGAGSPELTFGGQYDNKSKFIRIEMSTETMKANYRPSGYSGIPKVSVLRPVDPAHDIGVLSSYAGSSVPQLRYKTDNFISGTTPDSSKMLGVDYDTANISTRLSGHLTLGPSSDLVNDPGFIIFRNNSETGSTSAALTSTIGGFGNDTNTGGEGDNQQTFAFAVYDTVGTAANTAKYYQFSVPIHGGYDGLDQRKAMGTNLADGSLSAAYNDATSVLSNIDEYDFNILATPGITNASVGSIQGQAIDMVTGRGDAFFLAELGKDVDGTVDNKTLSVAEAVERANGIDSSYAGAWYPWVRIFDADNDELVWVPPSIQILGVLSFTDLISNPWFAPAGFNRGGLENVIEAYRRLTQSQRDELYEGKVNPIATFAGQGIFVFGQKTLQSKSSALDRINVRRMLLHARKLIASLSKSVLFENNTLQTRNRLSALVNQVLDPIKVSQGLAEFKIVIDATNNTPDIIDRNQIVGKIYLQPTKTAEIIILDFNIERTGASFEEV